MMDGSNVVLMIHSNAPVFLEGEKITPDSIIPPRNHSKLTKAGLLLTKQLSNTVVNFSVNFCFSPGIGKKKTSLGETKKIPDFTGAPS